MKKRRKLKLDELVVQSFVTGLDPDMREDLGGLIAITPGCETNNNPRCVSPLCMTVPDPCTNNGPPCVEQIGVF